MKKIISLILLAAMHYGVMAQQQAMSPIGSAYKSGPAGFIRNVHEMERSAANAITAPNKLVEQFYKINQEGEKEEERIGEEMYKQVSPMYAKASVKFIDEKNVTTPPTFPATAKLTSQRPGYVGLGNQETNLNPSDAQIATGPNHTVVLANGDARILNKQTGAIISHVSLPAFFSWSGFVFDPRIFYDPYGQRWVALALQNAGCNTDSKFRVLISNNNDPTQGWFWYDFDVDGSNVGWMDFAKLGFNKDWICISGNVRCSAVPGLYVIPKTAAYAAGSISYFFWNSIELGNPAFTFDNTLDKLYIVQTGNNNSGGVGYVNSWYISSAPQLFNSNAYGTSPWQAFATSDAQCPKQLGGPNFTAVNIFGHAIFDNCVYRNGSLWFTHGIFLPATGTTTRTSVQWWQVNPATAAVQQVGRIDDGSGATSLYYPSIGVNASSDAVVTYSIFNSTYYPSAAYNFRNAADAAGQLPTGIFYTSGGTADGDGRGGDYSQVAVDPLDDQSFWVVNQVPNGNWETRYALIPGYYGCYTDGNFGNNNWSGNTKNEASGSISSAEMIQSPSMVDYDAGTFIDLKPGFVASYGSLFNAYIDGCGGQRMPRYKSAAPPIAFPEMAKTALADDKVAVYPNPASRSFNIRYTLKKDETVKISIFGTDSKPVKTINNKQQQGLHTETIDASKMASGVYYALFETSSHSETLKIVVVH